MRKAIIPLMATAAAQLLVIGSIAAAFAFQPEAAQLPTVTIPVRADIEQGECIRQDPAPYEPITYHVPLDADLQQYTAEMCNLYEVPLELAYAVMQVESGYTVSATSSTGDYGLMQINSINAGWLVLAVLLVRIIFRKAPKWLFPLLWSFVGIRLLMPNALDACQNIKAGCYMLGSYLALYDGDINRTMMAYNLGKSGAEKAWNAGTRSTAYTDKVWSAMVGLLEEERDVS